MPIYVNMVRDPVERVISWYYYVRAPWYFVERKRAFPDLPLPNPNWLKKDFDTCVRRGDKECQYKEGDERRVHKSVRGPKLWENSLFCAAACVHCQIYNGRPPKKGITAFVLGMNAHSI